MVTRGTLWEIAGNPDDIVVTHTGPNDDGFFVGWINRGLGHRYKPLLSTSSVFSSPEEAESFMRRIVDFAKDFTEKDLEDPANPLRVLQCVTPQSFRALFEIIQQVKRGNRPN